MSNHVHFVCVPRREDALARTFNVLHMRYSQYFNRKKGLKGHLWQGQFYSCILDERHVYAAVRYVENNPVSDWGKYLRETGDEELLENIRRNAMTGRPCGDERFIEKLEKECGRRLRALPHGRPQKHK